MKDEEENGNDIPLDRDPNVVEDLKEEEKPDNEDEDMNDADEKSVSASEEEKGGENSEAEDSKS